MSNHDAMATVAVRKFDCLVLPGPGPQPTVQATLNQGSSAVVDAPIGRFVRLNASRLGNRGGSHFVAVLSELALLLSRLRTSFNNPLRLAPAFWQSSSHIRRFVTESCGLGLLSWSVARFEGWQSPDRLAHIDNLPPAERAALSHGRLRPDLLFEVGGLQIAGEARGRSMHPSPSQFIACPAAQQGRLNELATWSVAKGGARWVMAWTRCSDAMTVTDYFDPGERTSLVPEGVLARAEARREEQLWATAPPFAGSFLGRPVRGSWQLVDPAPQPDGTQRRLFLGITETEVEGVQYPQSIESPIDGRFEIDAAGRVAVIVDTFREAAPLPDVNALSRRWERRS
jgi:hypothetical protein